MLINLSFETAMSVSWVKAQKLPVWQRILPAVARDEGEFTKLIVTEFGIAGEGDNDPTLEQALQALDDENVAVSADALWKHEYLGPRPQVSRRQPLLDQCATMTPRQHPSTHPPPRSFHAT